MLAGLPLEPAPQRSDRTARHSSGDGLSTLALPSLAGGASEAVEETAFRFLLQRPLAEKEEKVVKEAEQKKEAGEKEARRVRLERRRKLKREFLKLYILRSLSCSRNSPPRWTPWILWPLLERGKKKRRGGRRQDVPGQTGASWAGLGPCSAAPPHICSVICSCSWR